MLELLQLHPPSDEGRRDGARERGDVVQQLEDAKGGNRLTLPFQSKWRHRFRADGAAHESLGRRADENLSGASSLLEALGDVHCVACGERLAGARDDLPGVDADPHLEQEGRDGVAHLEGRAYRSQGVVLVDLRDTEDCHRCVADELLHRAAVALEDRAQLRVVASHELA